MNIYDKRDQKTIINSRVIKTSSEIDCKTCKQPNGQQPPCIENPRLCNNIATALHLDAGYILYLRSNEIKHISESYKGALDSLENKSKDFHNAENDPLPF